jgi:hypothetical protein
VALLKHVAQRTGLAQLYDLRFCSFHDRRVSVRQQIQVEQAAAEAAEWADKVGHSHFRRYEGSGHAEIEHAYFTHQSLEPALARRTSIPFGGAPSGRKLRG